MRSILARAALLALLGGIGPAAVAADTNTFTIAAYNVRNWLTMPRGNQVAAPKSPAEKNAVVAILTHVAADVVGVVELGGPADLADLTTHLANQGLVYPHSEWVEGIDTNRHVAILSRFPIIGRQSRRDYTYNAGGNVYSISRGILDVTIKVNDAYTCRALVLHLKSKRRVDEGNESVMRREEARLVRRHIGKILKQDPRLNLIAIGDFNDEPTSEAVQTMIGTAPFQLKDLQPIAADGKMFTYLWEAQKSWGRIDYLLASQGMYAELVPGSARVADFSGWNTASDHRAVSARFYDHDRDGLPMTNAIPSPPPPANVSSHAKRVWIVMIGATLIGIIAVITVLRRLSPASPAAGYRERRS